MAKRRRSEPSRNRTATQEAEADESSTVGIDLQQAEFALELSKKAVERNEFRRNIEWKFAFAIWVALTTAAGFSLQTEGLGAGFQIAAICGALGVFAVHMIMHLCWLQPRNNADRSDAIKWERRAVKLSGISNGPAVRPFRGNGWAVACQLMITLIFACLLTAAVLSKPIEILGLPPQTKSGG